MFNAPFVAYKHYASAELLGIASGLYIKYYWTCKNFYDYIV